MRKRKGIRVCTKLMRSIEERIARRGDKGECMDLGAEKRAVVAAGEMGEEPPEMSDAGGG